MKRDAADHMQDGGTDAFRDVFDKDIGEQDKDKGKGNGNGHDQKPLHQLFDDAATLKTKVFEPIKYIVPGVIVEGLTILAGKPKVGKSWLVLHGAIAVARGGFTLGEIKCIEGDVLYCALEDNERRLQSRMRKLLQLQDWPKRLQYLCLGKLPRLNEGGLEKLKAWI